MNTKMFSRVILALSMSIVAMNVRAMPSYDDVLVVVNDNSPQSLEVGEYFKNARKIPEVNICHISVTDLQGSGNENGNMPLAERNSSVAAIKKYLADNNLSDKINYIVLTRGIPYFSQNDTGYQLFDLYLLFKLSESAVDSKIPDIFTYNKYYYYIAANYNNQSDYKFTQKKYGYYMISRLDGPGTVNIKKMIDSTGYPAYQSAKKEVKFLTMTPYFPAAVTAEIRERGNIKVVSPDIKNGEDISDVGKDIMFSYLNRVSFAYSPVTSVEPLAPYYASAFYGDTDAYAYYPNIYVGLTFLPGSLITCFRSFPVLYNHRMYGGMFKIDPATSKMTDYKKSDGSDMKFRHMSCVEYDPINNWVWCGTGDSPLNLLKDIYPASQVSIQTAHKYESRRGGGIAIYDADGNILNHLTKDNSPLLNNRVTKIAYDKYANCIWVAHYGGIQRYDLAAKAWSEIPELKNDFAAASNIYVDPYDADKVYFSFYYGNYANGTTLANAECSVFEYSKSAKTVKSYLIENNVKGIVPLMGKTSADTIWVVKDYYLYKYDLKNMSVLEKISIKEQIAEIAALRAADKYKLNPPSALTVIPAPKTALVTITCCYTYSPAVNGKTCVNKKYVLRVTDNGAVASTIELINSESMNKAVPYVCSNTIWSLIPDPENSSVLYLSSSDVDNVTDGMIMKSADQGKTWTNLTISSKAGMNMREIVTAPGGIIYGVRGFQFNQQNFSDFIVSGVCAFGGGLSHDGFSYNPTPATAPSGGIVPGEIYASSSDSENIASRMMFMILDGYYTGEARFGIFKQYPATGGGGYVSHMLVFEPKCAPYAPRVDEENMSTLIPDKRTIEIPLRSPGLPLAMDGFMASTINGGTVTIKNESGQPVTATIEYKSAGNKIVLTGDFSGPSYLVTLKCGINGIKNIKGSCLVNARADEFKDEITYIFGISTEIYTPQADVTGPVKMPSTNSKYDLIISKVWWTTAPVAGQPLTVNFEISNIGTVKTAAGTGTQKAKVYLNNVLADVKSYDDIAPKGKIALAATIPAASVVGGKQCKVMVWADATDKVAEIRETNNTNSASFMIETRPDLIVKEITLSPKAAANKPLTIYFKINNIGASATVAGAGVQAATVFVDGKSVGTVAYNDVPKGGSITKQLVLSSGIATAGIHKIKVCADTNNIVSEINENNNSLEKIFSIAK